MDMEGDQRHLSLGYFCPGWPPAAFPNGIVPYVSVVTEQLRALGYRTTVIASVVAAGEWGDAVYGLDSGPKKRTMRERLIEGVGYRFAPDWTLDYVVRRGLAALVRKVIKERGMELLEMEESFGLAGRIQNEISIPICVRLHGPWFLNGVALGLESGKEFERRVAQEGELLRQAVAITSASQDTLDRTRSYYGLALEKAVVIPNPVHPIRPDERWKLEGCDWRTVLFIGRFDRHKGGDLMIDAFAKVMRAIPEARLNFVGPDRGFSDDGGRKWSIEEYVRDRIPGGVESGSVTILGHRPGDEILRLRRGAMVTVVCSRYENFPYALVEAKAMGCPMVAAATGGIPEMIEDGEDGLLHRVEDAEDLAAKIVTLLQERDRAAAMGRRAAERCEQLYHPRVVVDRLLDYYERVLGRSPVPSTVK